ncbi:MAG: UDP-N-acetylglucosamine 2-epimerase (non-hydrolyzing), partial [Planctomycetes bacterium]|nr:UDP-N-acetylglucosamine 2-epimerase (non-hydrolyzing) [Planctomycetota bacterium]
ATTQQNLLRENIADRSIFITGNTVVDSLFWMRDKILASPKTGMSRFKGMGLPERFSTFHLSVSSSSLPQAGLVLITGHRRENFGYGMKNICSAISQLASLYPKIPFIFPVHLNPNVQAPVTRELMGLDNVFLIPPVDYESFLFLMMHSSIILSDSGGVQEEAPSLGKPVLVMREKTERPEGVEAGTCVLVGTSPDTIVIEANRLLSDAVEYKRRSSIRNPYGDGLASARIREILEASLRAT